MTVRTQRSHGRRSEGAMRTVRTQRVAFPAEGLDAASEGAMRTDRCREAAR